jgi:hypothetical protein
MTRLNFLLLIDLMLNRPLQTLVEEGMSVDNRKGQIQYTSSAQSDMSFGSLILLSPQHKGSWVDDFWNDHSSPKQT